MLIMATIEGDRAIEILESPWVDQMHILLRDESGVDIDLVVKSPVDWIEQLVEILNFMVDPLDYGDQTRDIPEAWFGRVE